MSTATKEKIMVAFHDDPAIKDKYLQRLRLHRQADEIIQGVTFEKNGKTRGCAIGCTLDKYDHKAYETELGIPMILARLEDRIFEGLPVEYSKDFPINFLSAISVGKDLSNIYKKFFIWMLVDAVDGVIKFAKTQLTKDAITNVAVLLSRSLIEKVTLEEFKHVRKAAWQARYAVDAAYAVADAAYAVDAAYAAAAAAYAAADAADAAVDAAVDVAAAAYAAYAAYAVADAVDARKKFYVKAAAKLIELLKAA